MYDWKRLFSASEVVFFLLETDQIIIISQSATICILKAQQRAASEVEANGVRASIILETDDLGIVAHFCVIPGLAPAGQFKPLFGASSFTTS